ncbi:MAG: hypothetical protein KatS3mg131_2902 [Candidatus Tectimicrobiota bacterium]|nr:MAG: hypothetical protein KatS3mg131_2902 [Candidatus Tectomicrobia bacterium]
MDQKNRRTGRAELPAVAPACRRLPEQCQRLLSALVLLPPLLAFLYFAPAAAVAGLVLVLVVLSLKEYFALLQEARLPAYAGTGYAAGVGLVLVAFLGGARWLPAALTGATALLVARGARGRKEAAFPALLYSLFAVWFVAWGASHLVLLRREAEGPWLLFLLCAVVWTGDSVAMYVGKALGRHKLAPAVSPGKTWEGAAGCVGRKRRRGASGK